MQFFLLHTTLFSTSVHYALSITLWFHVSQSTHYLIPVHYIIFLHAPLFSHPRIDDCTLRMHSSNELCAICISYFFVRHAFLGLVTPNLLHLLSPPSPSLIPKCLHGSFTSMQHLSKLLGRKLPMDWGGPQ